jgi:predicted enzyme related to lactoylglutathione lyase
MLSDSDSFASFSAGDIAAVRRFYAETLGLEATEANGMLTLHLRDGARVLVYPKADHRPADFTVLNFVVADLERTIDELVERGVSFERYEGFDQDERGIVNPPSPDRGPRIAWFKDPAGNILSVLQE